MGIKVCRVVQVWWAQEKVKEASISLPKRRCHLKFKTQHSIARKLWSLIIQHRFSIRGTKKMYLLLQFRPKSTTLLKLKAKVSLNLIRPLVREVKTFWTSQRCWRPLPLETNLSLRQAISISLVRKILSSIHRSSQTTKAQYRVQLRIKRCRLHH